MSYRSKIKICGIKSAAEARAVLACSSALCVNLERADGAKNLPQSGSESSIKNSNFCGENSERNFNSDAENATRNFNSDGQNFAQNFNQDGENFTCRAQNHANFTSEQNCDCDKDFSSGSRSLGDGSGVRMEFLGVIFVSSSKRRVSVETAREIARIAHENGAKCVGVFALSSAKHSAAACENFSDKTRGDEICEDKICASKSGSVEFYEAAKSCEKQCNDLSVNLNTSHATPASMEDLNSEIFGAEALSEEQILKICEACELDCAQIYGRISADFKAHLNTTGVEAWQVLSIGAKMPPLEGLCCDRILFDAKGASLGGNGVSFDWDLLRRAGLGCQGRDGATNDEKNCAGNTMQSTDDARGDFEYSTIRENCGEEKFYAECVENSGTKSTERSDRRVIKDDEMTGCVHAVTQPSGTNPAMKDVDDQSANDYGAGALDIAEGSKAGGSGFVKDDRTDKRGNYPQNGAISFILAGGIGVQNILEALALRPYAIDINSRVEDARGIKEPRKISEILRIIESADDTAD